MQFLPVFAIAGLFLTLAFRLFRSAVRTGGAERWLAAFFVTIAFALPLRTVSVNSGLELSGGAALVNGLAHGLLSVSIICFTIFLWRVFRGQETWAKALAVGIIASQVFGLVALIALGGHRVESSNAVLAINLSRGVAFAWAFFESCRYHRMMARRETLGMGDPVVTNRFALFSIWTGALFFLPFAIATLRIYVRLLSVEGDLAGAPAHSTVMNVVRVCVLLSGLVATAALWLSFFPPQRYLAKLEARRAAI